MRQLGISIYPEKSDKEAIIHYLDSAAEAGFTRIFSCLLSVNKDKERLVNEFREINHYAKSLGFEVIVDVSPRVFSALGISYDDLNFFAEIGAHGLRLDQGFSGAEEALMTYNPQGLKIEINMSNDVHTIDTIMDYQPNTYNLMACHNFYPHAYSALGQDYFLKCSQNFNKYGLRTAAFITSQAPDTFGPWPVTDGLPTLETHRHLPIDTQLLHHLILNAVDDIIISNCFASQEEIHGLGKSNLTQPSFAVECIADLPEIERSIIFDDLHFNRGDISEHMIRSSQSRVKHKGHHFAIINAPEIIHRGDIIIESSDYGHYAGELQIALQDMKNSGKSNVVGRIRPDQVFIIDDIKPWQKFRFIPVE